MSDPIQERLYNLLPSVYRLKDASEGEPLRTLMAVIEKEMKAIESDIDGLYNNWFIETCDEWAVSYIGDLLGVRSLHSLNPGVFSQRAYVANTLAYRRRKGTILVLEQLAKDVTGWPAKAVEFFKLLAVAQNLNHVRLDCPASRDVRNASQLELLDEPFDRSMHTANIRSIFNGDGWYNIPNIGIFLWRLQSYPVSKSTAFHQGDRRYSFNPLGNDIPLFNWPNTEKEITHATEEVNVPGRLRRRTLHDELEELRKSKNESKTYHGTYFGDRPVLQIYLGSQAEDPVKPEQIIICNLKEWDKDYPCSIGCSKGNDPKFKPIVAVDPELGRIVLLGKDIDVPDQVLVSYSYGFGGDIGAGPYDRRDSLQRWFQPDEVPVTWMIGVTQNRKALTRDPDHLRSSLADALQDWNEYTRAGNRAFGIIAIMDSNSYEPKPNNEDPVHPTSFVIEAPEGCRLAIVAAEWPLTEDGKDRLRDFLVADELLPHLKGDLFVSGTASERSENPGEVVLDGLLIEGKVTVKHGNLGSLQLYHCTLVPDKGGLEVSGQSMAGIGVLTTASEGQNEHLSIYLNKSICGLIRLANLVPELTIEDSILDSGGPSSIEAPGTDLSLERSTVCGANVRSLNASNSIFTEVVMAVRKQVGCVRFCYLPPESQTPRRYCCQPEMAPNSIEVQGDLEQISRIVVPIFTSMLYGQPGYAQLSCACVDQIRKGAEDGSEMGAFSSLKQPHREANLRTSLEEYLRFGLDAGIFYMD